MYDETMRVSKEIFNLLKEAGIELDVGLSNSIILKVADAFETGREQGVKKGIGKAIDEFENKLYIMRDKLLKE